MLDGILGLLHTRQVFDYQIAPQSQESVLHSVEAGNSKVKALVGLGYAWKLVPIALENCPHGWSRGHPSPECLGLLLSLRLSPHQQEFALTTDDTGFHSTPGGGGILLKLKAQSPRPPHPALCFFRPKSQPLTDWL